MKQTLEKLLNSNFEENHYKNVIVKAVNLTNHKENIINFIEQEVLNKVFAYKFLDIGPGPGYITKRIAKHFLSTTIVEPNLEYESLYSKSYDIHIGKFEEVNLEGTFNLVLCSHVLYHLEQRQWTAFVSKLYDSISANGIGVITLVAPRGKFHDLCFSINQNYSNSNKVIKILDNLNIKYEIKKSNCKYEFKDYDAFYKLIKLFAVDDCFTPNEFEKLSKEDKNKIESKLQEFTKKCLTEKGTYKYISEEDYFLIKK